MRHLLKVTLLAIILSTSVSTFAQTLKFGHIDSNKLLSIMPEKEEAHEENYYLLNPPHHEQTNNMDTVPDMTELDNIRELIEIPKPLCCTIS